MMMIVIMIMIRVVMIIVIIIIIIAIVIAVLWILLIAFCCCCCWGFLHDIVWRLFLRKKKAASWVWVTVITLYVFSWQCQCNLLYKGQSEFWLQSTWYVWAWHRLHSYLKNNIVCFCYTQHDKSFSMTSSAQLSEKQHCVFLLHSTW